MSALATTTARTADRVRGQFLVNALLGCAGWIVLALAGWIVPQSGHRVVETLFLFAPLVVVPLGLRLAGRQDGAHALLYKALAYLHALAALSVAGSLLLEPGVPSGFLAGIWAAFCALVAGFGVTRFLARPVKRLEELAIDVGLVYVAVGGAWFVLSRLGQRPMGFGHDIVALTGVHFHYAGFAAPIVVGLSGRALALRGRTPVLWRVGAIGAITCPIVVAAGILSAPVVEVVSAFVLAIALTLAMVVAAARTARTLPTWTAWLLWASALALPTTMALACVYALGEFIGAAWIDVEHMAVLHGVVNVFGFALPGLAAWTLAEPRAGGVSATRAA